jgi:hypothetical protein
MRKSPGNFRTRRRVVAAALAIGVIAGTCQPGAGADEPRERPAREEPAGDESSEREVTMKTLGGMQFWGDVLFFHDWRIQKSILTGRYRLLDGRNNRHAAGTLDECRQKLDEIKKSRNLPPMKGKVGFDYPSTRVEISDAAEYLRSVIESLDGIEEINFVVHSMGGLVVRSYSAQKPDPRIRRLVMIGVPNQGADLADRLKENPVYRAIFGPAGQQLVSDPKGFISTLPTPEFEFGVIAGSRGSIDGYNPLIPGDDDGTVAVKGTRLPGASDFIAVRGLHTFLMSNDEAIACTLRYIEHGKFREEGNPHPIPRDGSDDFEAGDAGNNGVTLGKPKPKGAADAEESADKQESSRQPANAP